MPAPMMAMVMPSESAAGNFSRPSRSAMKIFEPMKTSTIASAGFRYSKRWIIAASAK